MNTAPTALLEGSTTLPLYEYRCTQCGHHFEKIQSFSSAEETECPKCHGKLERPLTAPALQFKGAGWYVNDYAPKAASGSSSKNDSADSISASAADTKSGSDSKSTADSNSSSSDSAAKPATSESTPKPAATESAAKPSTPAAS